MPFATMPGLFQSTSRPLIVDERTPEYSPNMLLMLKMLPPRCRSSSAEMVTHLYLNELLQPPTHVGLTPPSTWRGPNCASPLLSRSCFVALSRSIV